jgi:adenosylcobinamide kinase/adenosylcobinamide-phosphate guanylyltransferase
MRELILGGARSGKSAWAEQRALAAEEEEGLRVLYLATARVEDAEMAARVAHHRARRPAHWGTREEAIHLADCLAREAAPETCVVVDCLTLWLTALVFAGQAAVLAEAGGEFSACPLFAAETGKFLATLPKLPGRIILVANEVGCGIVPTSPLSRRFADEQGRLNQRVAALCEQVTLITAGLPLRLK